MSLALGRSLPALTRSLYKPINWQLSRKENSTSSVFSKNEPPNLLLTGGTTRLSFYIAMNASYENYRPIFLSPHEDTTREILKMFRFKVRPEIYPYNSQMDSFDSLRKTLLSLPKNTSIIHAHHSLETHPPLRRSKIDPHQEKKTVEKAIKVTQIITAFFWKNYCATRFKNTLTIIDPYLLREKNPRARNLSAALLELGSTNRDLLRLASRTVQIIPSIKEQKGDMLTDSEQHALANRLWTLSKCDETPMQGPIVRLSVNPKESTFGDWKNASEAFVLESNYLDSLELEMNITK